MKTSTYQLKTGKGGKLDCYILGPIGVAEHTRKRPAVLIFPGGAYVMVSDREAEPVAMKFLSKGYNAFILTYSTNIAHPIPLLQASEAISYIRENAKEFMIDKDAITVIGFSAGGHLAASIGTLWNNDISYKPLGLRLGDNKPNALVLSYPVITSGDEKHDLSIDILTESIYNEELYTLISAEKQVTKLTPPTFIWHTANDSVVPVENSLLFAAALSREEIPFELHIYESGPHGLSVCDETSSDDISLISKNCAGWFEQCVLFLDKKFRN